jgi:hypothetical protein
MILDLKIGLDWAWGEGDGGSRHFWIVEKENRPGGEAQQGGRAWALGGPPIYPLPHRLAHGTVQVDTTSSLLTSFCICLYHKKISFV